MKHVFHNEHYGNLVMHTHGNSHAVEFHYSVPKYLKPG